MADQRDWLNSFADCPLWLKFCTKFQHVTLDVVQNVQFIVDLTPIKRFLRQNYLRGHPLPPIYRSRHQAKHRIVSCDGWGKRSDRYRTLAHVF